MKDLAYFLWSLGGFIGLLATGHLMRNGQSRLKTWLGISVALIYGFSMTVGAGAAARTLGAEPGLFDGPVACLMILLVGGGALCVFKRSRAAGVGFLFASAPFLVGCVVGVGAGSVWGDFLGLPLQ